MTYLNAFLAEEASYGWQAGPEFKTSIVDQTNGDESRNGLWAEGRHRLQMPFANIDRTVYAAIKRMHLVARGRLHNFKVVDQLDYEAVDEEFGEGDGVATEFQLSKLSAIDGVYYSRNCYVIIACEVEVDGVVTAVTLDERRGKVVFGAAPANGAVLTWSGTFGLWVRFDQDYLPFSLDNLDTINGAIDLIECRPPGDDE